jgi:Uma2 family endonuclease
MALTGKLMTADELLRLPDDGMRHELVAGELRSYPYNDWKHGVVAAQMLGLLWQHVDENRLGWLFAGGTGFILAQNPDTVRAADIAFWRCERSPETDDPDGYWIGAPDLIVEVVSVFDLYLDIDDKIADWLRFGCRLALVVNPPRRTVAVYHLNQPVRVLAEADVLDGEDVVPGWTLPVRDIFTHGLVD